MHQIQTIFKLNQLPSLLVACVMASVFYLFQFSRLIFRFSFRTAFKSEVFLKIVIMKFFKSDKQEIQFYIVGSIICLSIVLFLKLLKLWQ